MRMVLQQLEHKLRRIRRIVNPLLIITSIACFILIIFSFVDIFSPTTRRYLNENAHINEPRSRALALILVGIVGMIAALWIWRTLPRDFRLARDIRETRANVVANTNELKTLLDQEIDRLLRLDANALSERKGSLALTPEAPGLVESESIVPSGTPDIVRLRDLISNASTSAFALAGPRGIGKTTLIRALTSGEEEFDIASIVPAPVKYEPDALLARIHADVARQILVKHKAGNLLTLMQQSIDQETRYFRRNLAIAALVTGFVVLALNFLQGSIFGSIGDGGIFGIILIFAAYIVLRNLKSRKFAPAGDDSEIIQNAIDALESLRWSTEETRTAKTSFSAAKIFIGLEDTDSSKRTERDRSRPQLVDDLASFLRRHLELTSSWQNTLPVETRRERSRIIIAVDELDKLSDPEQILEAVNNLKDLFRIRDIHFLVSVSSDVMTRFALRGVVSRDAFDSSFDAVIEMRRLSCDRSHEILLERAIGFPSSLSAVCHAWSGGLPRDLIRIARRCVEYRRLADRVTPIDEISSSVIAQDIAQTLIALRTIEHQEQDDDEKLTPSTLTVLINELNCIPQVGVDSKVSSTVASNLNNLLSKYLYAGNHMHPAVRSSVTKLLVGGVLTATFAVAAARRNDPKDRKNIFAVSDTIAFTNSLQNETLGEVLAAAEEVVGTMNKFGMQTTLDLRRVAIQGSKK